MKKTALISFALSLFIPVGLVLAQGSFNPSYPNQVINSGVGWLRTAITVIMVLMTLFFLINVFRYVAEKDPTKLKDRRKAMLAGLIGLFVAVSVWGIIRIAGNTLGTNNSAPVPLTCPPGTTPVGNTCV